MAGRKGLPPQWHKAKKRLISKNMAEIGRALGLKYQTISSWANNEPDFPRGEDGTLDTQEIEKWITARDDDFLLAKKRKADESPAIERYRLAKAKIAELELAELQKALVKLESVKHALSQHDSAVRLRLQQIPGPFALQFPPDLAPIIKKKLEEELSEACRAIDENEKNITLELAGG